MSIDRKELALAAALAGLVLGGCNGSTGAGEAVEAPVAETRSAVAAPASLDEIFPVGLGRSAVLDNCGACHAVACSAIGQRTQGRWAALKEDHRDKVPDISQEDYDALFAYLSANFNDAAPEPAVPPQFLEGGCTPF